MEADMTDREAAFVAVMAVNSEEREAWMEDCWAAREVPREVASETTEETKSVAVDSAPSTADVAVDNAPLTSEVTVLRAPPIAEVMVSRTFCP